MNKDDFSAWQQVEFIDHSTIAWNNVRRTCCLFYQRFHYHYPGPIRDLKQRLVVVPADQYGTQHVRDHALVVNPSPIATRQAADKFGNRVLELEVPEADGDVLFEVLMLVESEALPPYRPATLPMRSTHEMDHWLQPTRLTTPDHAIYAIAHQLRQDSSSSHDLAQRINDWVFQTMNYQGSVTTVDTTAAEALLLGHGLCQDYSHLMLAICRAAHLPARYVSGHLLGEGGSHAWVEVFLPTEQGLIPFAFDPVNNRQPHLGYITVAVGRDYQDISPTSGSFTAPYNGQLTCSKRAGLTLVEYLNGEILQSLRM